MAPDEGCRALPLLHERIASEETPMEKGAAQLRLACILESHRACGHENTPIEKLTNFLT
jgi:hypothetical protein